MRGPWRDETGRSTTIGTAARLMNDVGLAAWFAAEVHRARPAEAPVVGSERPPRHPGPLELAAMGVHSVGAAYLTLDNRERLLGQRGVLPVAIAKAVLTIAAIAATLRGLRSGDRASARAGAALTGATLVANSVLGEQQRPRLVARGVLAGVVRGVLR